MALMNKDRRRKRGFNSKFYTNVAVIYFLKKSVQHIYFKCMCACLYDFLTRATIIILLTTNYFR